MQKLTPQFNTATVQKGDMFQINLFEGGFVGQVWDMEVVAGKAQLVSVSNPGSAGISEKVFKAEEFGDIEIIAKGRMAGGGNAPNGLHTFKIRVS